MRSQTISADTIMGACPAIKNAKMGVQVVNHQPEPGHAAPEDQEPDP